MTTKTYELIEVDGQKYIKLANGLWIPYRTEEIAPDSSIERGDELFSPQDPSVDQSAS
jgi:hypothetical protein